MATKKVFYFQITDTFGGEANFCWVRRYKVEAASLAGALRKVSKEAGFTGRLVKDWSDGMVTRWNIRNAALCVFGEEFDEYNHGHEVVKEL